MLDPHQERLTSLYRLSRILAEADDLTRALEQVLSLLHDHARVIRGAVILTNPVSAELQVEAAFGLSRTEVARGRYSLGEGVTGRVVAAGQAMAVPRVAEEPLFLDKTGARKGRALDISFVCVPIRSHQEVIGALWADLPARTRAELDEDTAFLELVAGLISQSVAQLEAERLDEENRSLKSQLGTQFGPTGLIGQSAAMVEVFSLINKVSRSRTTVLIRGESGTGKGLVAAAIHYASPRAKGPYIKVNCAALPESLIESELFGHERGAFTGAVKSQAGRFEQAQGGTIFLDEIGSLPLNAQAKLLRVIQEKEMERLGSGRTVSLDVRLIAATNKNLEAALGQGDFREDLYYRLNVFPVHLPPLRERRTDILLLVDHFVEKFSREHDRDVRKVSPEAIDLLLNHAWPGNVRELENCLERAVLLTEDRTIRPFHLPATLQALKIRREPVALPQAVAELESDLIRAALHQTKGNSSKAAKLLGITPRIIGYKIRKYGLDPDALA